MTSHGLFNPCWVNKLALKERLYVLDPLDAATME